ncbi:polysaccharide deacetylase family protein [Pseudomonas benzenivorans]|uniref:Polysaccharide deacetylase family protein n=1 Tax=Pseudomonas benzenivorans TaxID=556533 RepID=A0ABZ0PYF4_9PSED|nr:polysaccharide deacetylase family protein [Pseudomonas benzenivorans]WPC06242.1 polysaccharide deacetylase family protein [Pseudomonas benzenivorans]
MVHVVVNVEHWCFDQPMPRTLLTPPHGRQSVPDIPNFSWVEYGMRCGLPRMIEALQSRGIKASTSFNASVIDAYPQAAEALLNAGWEFIGHGMHQRGMQDELNEAEVINVALDKIAAFTGTRPRGWLSPGLRETSETPELLQQAGIDHVFDWVLDDLPAWMDTRHGPLLSVPYNLELNDSVIYAVEKHASPEFYERLASTLRLFEREAVSQPRILALGLHPHLMGVPHRFGYFERMLDLLQQSPQVCFMTGTQIADWYRAQVPAGRSLGN